MDKRNCDICNKTYASYQSLWNHNKRFHQDKDLNNIKIVPKNIKIVPKNIKFVPKNIKIVPNNIKIVEKFPNKNLNCNYCDKLFKYDSSKSFHMKLCKLNHPEIQIIDNKNTCKICNKKFNSSSSFCRHRKICQQEQIVDTTNHINNSITISNTNNSNNNSNNNTINYITQMINFSDNCSGFYSLLSIKHKKIILDSGKYTINKIVEFTILNKNHPEINNIFILNLKDKFAYIFENIKFIVSEKSECLDDIINFCINIIDEFINDKTINESAKKYLKIFYSKLKDLDSPYEDKKNMREYVSNTLKLFIYSDSSNNNQTFKSINSQPMERLKLTNYLEKIEDVN